MNPTITNHRATLSSLIFVIFFWLSCAFICYDSSTNNIMQGSPGSSYIITSLALLSIMSITCGIFLDYKKRKLTAQLQTSNEHQVYNAMVFAMQQVLNNYINGMELMRIEAMRCKDFDHHVIDLYNHASREAMEAISRLSKLDDLSEENIMSNI